MNFIESQKRSQVPTIDVLSFIRKLNPGSTGKLQSVVSYPIGNDKNASVH